MNPNHAQYYTQAYMMQFLKMTPPFNAGMLRTHDNERIAFAEFGNPTGAAVICIHGGPGGGSQPIDLSFFDLTTQRVILYDQRHCMNSKTSTNWKNKNTTQLLINDLEQLRKHLNLTAFNIFAGSWGSTLALCYAIENPNRVSKMVLWGILLGRQSCIDFVSRDMCSPMEQFYCDHNFFIPENYILNNLAAIQNHEISIAHGTEDPICNYQNSELLHQQLPNSELYLAQGEGHHPYMPQLFNFLSNKAKDLK